jgi:hypothetical protein
VVASIEDAEAYLEDAKAYFRIIDGGDPDPDAYKAGWDAHEAGKPFGEGPRPFHTIKALSWRIGWNDRAIGKRPIERDRAGMVRVD